MRLIHILFALTMLTYSSVFADDDNFTIVDLAKTEKPLQELIQFHVTQAEEKGQKIFVQLTAEWCVPCKNLRASMDKLIVRLAFEGTYIVRVDSDEWTNELKDINIKLGAIPSFHQINSDGISTNYSFSGTSSPTKLAPRLQRYFQNAN